MIKYVFSFTAASRGCVERGPRPTHMPRHANAAWSPTCSIWAYALACKGDVLLLAIILVATMYIRSAVVII